MNTEKSKKINKNMVTLLIIIIIILGCYFLSKLLLIQKYTYSQFSPNGKYKVYIEEIPTGAWSSFRFNICLQKNILNLGSIKLPIELHSKTLAASSPEIIVKWENDEKFSLWEKSVGEGKVWIDYICEYTIDSFIDSDTFINARNKEFREEMEKLKTVKDLTKEEMQKLKTVEELKYEEENSFEEENDVTLLWHKQAHVWIMNSEKELLIQRINQSKEGYLYTPYISVDIQQISGGKEKEVIKKELEKEIDAEIDMDKLEYLFSLDDNDNDNDIETWGYGIYLLEMDLDLNSIKLKEEVNEFKNIYYEDFATMLIKNENNVINPWESKVTLATIYEKYGN